MVGFGFGLITDCLYSWTKYSKKESKADLNLLKKSDYILNSNEILAIRRKQSRTSISNSSLLLLELGLIDNMLDLFKMAAQPWTFRYLNSRTSIRAATSSYQSNLNFVKKLLPLIHNNYIFFDLVLSIACNILSCLKYHQYYYQ